MQIFAYSVVKGGRRTCARHARRHLRHLSIPRKPSKNTAKIDRLGGEDNMADKREGAGSGRIADHKFYGLMVAAGYGVVSITITLFNKAVFNFYEFKFPLSQKINT